METKNDKLIQINFKSGHQIELWFEEFTISSGRVQWQVSSRYQNRTDILWFELDDIESMVQVTTE